METVVYGENEITGVTVSVQSSGTVAVSRGFNSTIGIVGNMNTQNGTATPGEVVDVSSPTQADELFGQGSELSQLVRDGFNNGVYDILAVGAPETPTTETFSGKSSGVLKEEIADPNVTQHTVDVVETTSGDPVDVTISYESPPTPNKGAAVNPVTREVVFATSGDYEVSYTAQKMQDPIDRIAQENLRFLTVATENEGVLQDALAVVHARAQDFAFMRVVGGAQPRLNAQNYSDSLADQRMVLVAPSRGYKGEAQTNEARTCGAVSGTLAARPLGSTATSTFIDGFVSIYDYPDTDIATLDSAGLLVLNKTVQGIEIVRDRTTSTDVQFSRVYACEIVDDFTFTSHLVARQFIGRLNTQDNRDALEMSLANLIYDAQNTTPPLLDDGTVDVVNGPGADEVSAHIGLDVVDVIDRIYINIQVGPILRNDGTTVEEPNVGTVAPT